MNAEQKHHLERMQKQVVALLTDKYTKGTIEHKSNLWDSDVLIDEAIDEVIDLFTYLATLKEQLGRGYKPFDHVAPPPKESTNKVALVKRADDKLGVGISYPQKDGDVGYDLIVSENTFIPPFGADDGKATIVPSNAHIKIPDGYYAQIVGRSSAANKKGILVHTATIDNGYTGQLFACCWNMSAEPKTALKGERLAQVIFLPIHTPPMEEVNELPATSRGETGFGSTGN